MSNKSWTRKKCGKLNWLDIWAVAGRIPNLEAQQLWNQFQHEQKIRQTPDAFFDSRKQFFAWIGEKSENNKRKAAANIDASAVDNAFYSGRTFLEPGLLLDMEGDSMSKMIIGIDPDAAAHGVAIYLDGQLRELHRMTLIELMNYLLDRIPQFEVVVSMENVLRTNAVFKHNQQDTKRKTSKVSNNIGRCQQSCVELVRLFEFLDVPCQLVVPGRGDWKHDKRRFEQITGWHGKSNEDTRSAAFFGFLLAGSATNVAAKG